MQTQPDRGYRYIMNYQDHMTKFCSLRALKTKRAPEIAYHLLDIFTTFGAPRILQSDNGREFVANVIEELKDLWPELILVHGKARHPQSQGSVERANGDVEDILRSWLNDNQTSSWSSGLRFVQLQKNTAFSRIMKLSPFRALFGQDPIIGFSNDFPIDVLERMKLLKEEDLEPYTSYEDGAESSLSRTNIVLQEMSNETGNQQSDNQINFIEEAQDIVSNGSSTSLSSIIFESNLISTNTESRHSSINLEDQRYVADSDSSINTTCKICLEQVLSSQKLLACSYCRQIIHEFCCITSELPNGKDIICVLCEREKNQLATRSQVSARQKRSANNMIETAVKKLACGKENDCVLVPIPTFDRAKTDHKNLLGVITNHDTQNNVYEITTEYGRLDKMFSQNQFELTNQQILTRDNVANITNVVSVRTASRSASIGHGQGFQRCGCSGNCVNKRCICKKSGLLCNSRCHANGKKCENKC